MSDVQQEPTIDDIWINRIASRLGIVMAQNERLQLEVEMLREQLKQLQPESESNGEVQHPEILT